MTLQQQPFQGSTPVVEDGLRPGHLAHEAGDVPLEAPVDHVVVLTHASAHGIFARCQCSRIFEVVEGDNRCPTGKTYARYWQARRMLDVSLIDDLARLDEQERRDRDEWATASQLGARA